MKNDPRREIIKVPRFTEELGFKTTEKVSAVMKKIRSGNTTPEVIFRKALWSLGLRYRLRAKGLPGKPDIVFKRKKIAIFIDGDFWHGYNWHERKKKMKSNLEYWIPKIERNIQRDKEVNDLLRSNGWIVLRFWEHEVKKNITSCIGRVLTEFTNFANTN